jgi:hypothetical protein
MVKDSRLGKAGLRILAGCLWLVSGLLLVPAIFVIGMRYHYDLHDWLSLLSFPAEADEVGPWIVRIALLLTFLGSTVWLAVLAFGRRTRSDG